MKPDRKREDSAKNTDNMDLRSLSPLSQRSKDDPSIVRVSGAVYGPQTEESVIFAEGEPKTRRGSIWEQGETMGNDGRGELGLMQFRSIESWRGDMEWGQGSQGRSLSPLLGKRGSPMEAGKIKDAIDGGIKGVNSGREIVVLSGEKENTGNENTRSGMSIFNPLSHGPTSNLTEVQKERKGMSLIKSWLGELEPVKERLVKRRKRIQQGDAAQSSSKDGEYSEHDSSGSKNTIGSGGKKGNLFQISGEKERRPKRIETPRFGRSQGGLKLKETPRFRPDQGIKDSGGLQIKGDRRFGTPNRGNQFDPMKILQPNQPKNVIDPSSGLVKIFDPKDFFPNPPEDPMTLLKPFLISQQIIRNMMDIKPSSPHPTQVIPPKQKITRNYPISGDVEKCRKLAKRLRRAWNLNQQISQNVFKKLCLLSRNDQKIRPISRRIEIDTENRNFSNKTSNKGSVKKAGPTPETQGELDSDRRVLRMSTRRKKRMAREKKVRDGVEGESGAKRRREYVEFLDFSFKNINKFLQSKE